MNVSVSLDETDRMLVAIEGEIDALRAPELDEVLEKALPRERILLAIDLSAVRYISSGGLRCLLRAHKDVKRRGGEVRLFGLSQQVRKIFETAGFDRVLTIVKDQETALKRKQEPRLKP